MIFGKQATTAVTKRHRPKGDGWQPWRMSARELMIQLKEYGWSFRDIEKELDISRSTLSRIRNSPDRSRANEEHFRLLLDLYLRINCQQQVSTGQRPLDDREITII